MAEAFNGSCVCGCNAYVREDGEKDYKCVRCGRKRKKGLA